MIDQPPQNSKNKFTVKQFLDECSSFLENRIHSAENRCIVGDFNFHMDDLKVEDGTNVQKLLDSFDLSQSVQDPTDQKRSYS